MSKQTEKFPSLEESMTEINQLIDKMEHSELTLDQSLGHFERGISLIRHCQKVLQEAEQKVQILMQNNQQGVLADYQTEKKADLNGQESE